MVVIFGWGSDGAKDLGEVAPVTCPKCHNQVFLHHLHSDKQVSLYFVPLASYGSDDYLACPICRSGMQLSSEHMVPVQQMRAATAVYRRGGVDTAHYLATVQAFWARIGVDASGRQVLSAPPGVPAPAVVPPPQVIPSAAPSASSSAAAAPGPSLAEQLGRLGTLRSDGVLTDEEFAAAKARLLGG